MIAENYFMQGCIEMEILAGVLLLFGLWLIGRSVGGKKTRNNTNVTDSSSGSRQTVEFSYSNADGEQSRRVVDVIYKEKYNFRAYCHLRGENRTFRFDRITGDIVKTDTGEIITVSQFAGRYIPSLERVNPMVEPDTIEEAIAPHIDFLEGFGWTVRADDKEIGVFRKFKNGKMRKTPDIFIVYIEDDERTRPWYVRSNSLGNARTYKYLSSAVEKFVGYAKPTAELVGLTKLS